MVAVCGSVRKPPHSSPLGRFIPCKKIADFNLEFFIRVEFSDATAGLLLGVFGVLFVVAHRLGGVVDHPIGIAFTVAALISMARHIGLDREQ